MRNNTNNTHQAVAMTATLYQHGCIVIIADMVDVKRHIHAHRGVYTIRYAGIAWCVDTVRMIGL